MLKRVLLASTLLVSACSGHEAFGPDKIKHAGAGILVGHVAEELGMTEQQACVTVILTGVAKELIDPIFSPMDVVATSLYCIKLLEEVNDK